MAYEKQNFEDGTVLEAEHLNHTEDGMVEIENEVAGKQPKGYYITEETDPTVPEWAKNEKKPAYTAEEVGARPEDWTPSAEDVGADPAGTATSEVSGHNVDADAHSDIRIILEELKTAVTAFLDVDDETKNELSEVLALIDANKTSIQEITSGKVNVKDIVDNLTTNLSKRALSAAQGVVLKAMIDALQKLIDALQTSLSNHTSDGTAHITAAERAAWNNKQPAGNYSEEGHTHSQYAKQTDLDKQAEEIADHKTEIDDQLDGMKVTMVQEVLAQINGEAGSIFGQVNEDGTITITTDLVEGDYTIMYENEDGTLTEVGTITVGEVAVYYSIARTLAACTSNKTETNIEEGASWTETITANDGYELSNVTVKMGGSDVTSSVYSGGVITIPAVTGDIVITATATEIVEEPYTNLFDKNGSGFSDQSTKFYTNWLPYNHLDNGGKGTMYHFKGLSHNAGYTNPYKMSLAMNTSGLGATAQMYCTKANNTPLTDASYDSSVKVVQHCPPNGASDYHYVQFEIREAVPANLIITANQDIIGDTSYNNLADPTNDVIITVNQEIAD